ncbi:menaquinone biosynthesis protein [Acidipila sp. 4G-K13]|uniref:Chorismate dehydratase n=2 Tax=Paracidobacterium acidisoli TaxID=2303751 RepID=A0A372IUV4_9BACT|nr:menaquinone biosynthesis protein [Paracidobacterium acidisoli]
MWSFEHEPGKTFLSNRYTIESSTPAECAARLADGTADIGLVPIAAYASNPSLSVIPGCAIASLDCVRSIILVVRHPGGLSGVERVALDTSSRTSATYTRILFHRFWKRRPEFLPHPPDLEAMLRTADAALLIGDPALLALEDRERRERETGEQLLYLDLAHEWRMLTGTPWVSAFWAIRPESLADTGIAAPFVIQDFQRSRDAGMAHIDDLVEEWTGRIVVPPETIRTYLTQNIWYLLDDACLSGMDLFYRYGVECGALPAVPRLKFL